MKIDTDMLRVCNEIVKKVDRYFLLDQNVIRGEKVGDGYMVAHCKVEYTSNGDFEIKIPIPFPELEIIITRCDSGRYIDLSGTMLDSHITLCLYRNDQIVCAFNECFYAYFIDMVLSYVRDIVSDYDNEN